jgi:hypothetical protein
MLRQACVRRCGLRRRPNAQGHGARLVRQLLAERSTWVHDGGAGRCFVSTRFKVTQLMIERSADPSASFILAILALRHDLQRTTNAGTGARGRVKRT